MVEEKIEEITKLFWKNVLEKQCAYITAASCFSGKVQENQGLWNFERGFLCQI